MADKEAIRALFPGKTIKLDERVHATVYPLGVPHIRRFTDHLVGAFSTLARTGIRSGGSESEVGARFMGALLPQVVASMTDILDECVVVDVYPTLEDAKPTRVAVSDLPHHYLPPIAEHWVRESFGDEGKREPWLQAARGIWGTITGEEVSTSEMLSRCASALGTHAPTSSS